MNLVPVVLALAVIGFLVWLVLQIPMAPIFRNVIVGVVCFVLVIWVLQLFGVHTGLPSIYLK